MPLATLHAADKLAHFQRIRWTPNFDKEGLPSLQRKASTSHTFVFANASTVFLRDAERATGIKQLTTSALHLAWRLRVLYEGWIRVRRSTRSCLQGVGRSGALIPALDGLQRCTRHA